MRLNPYVTSGDRITVADVKRARNDKHASTRLPPAAPTAPTRFKGDASLASHLLIGTDHVEPEPHLIAFLLDRSGTMQSIESDVIGGFEASSPNGASVGECRVTLAQFANEYEVVYHARPLADVSALDLNRAA